MEGPYSPAAERAIALAKARAHQRAAEVEPIDLLLALVLDEASPTRAVLGRHGANLEALMAELGVGAALDVGAAIDALWSDAARAALARARQLSVAFNRYQPIGTEEILAGVLETWPDAAALCRRWGIDQEGLLREYHRERDPAVIPVDPTEIDLRPGGATAEVDLARIVDASANRLREALRVIEDYARFALDDRGLCERLKALRHRLREAIGFLPESWLLAARETERDVGADIATRQEAFRRDARAVVSANFKRAQEALRSLEEFSKVENVTAARVFEALRYELYSLERRLGLAERARQRLANVTLYWLLDPDQCVKSLSFMIEEATRGGVQAIQLRDKSSNDRERMAIARRVRELTARHGALLFVNDRPDIARLVEADGVHLGQEDLSVKDARRILGPEAMIGVSTHEMAQAEAAVADGADYIGVGPVFASKTKEFERLAGLEFVRQAAERIALPAFAIGGIDPETVGAVVAAGARRIAVSAALNRAAEPYPVACALRRAVDAAADATSADLRSCDP